MPQRDLTTVATASKGAGRSRTTPGWMGCSQRCVTCVQMLRSARPSSPNQRFPAVDPQPANPAQDPQAGFSCRRPMTASTRLQSLPMARRATLSAGLSAGAWALVVLPAGVATLSRHHAESLLPLLPPSRSLLDSSVAAAAARCPWWLTAMQDLDGFAGRQSKSPATGAGLRGDQNESLGVLFR
ncbi:MAG: hypothetical protein RLZZ336_2153 [Cyanobacteriota bacterium]